MSERELIKGNEALAYGALRSGLNAYFGYPITPSSEVPETLAMEFGSPEFPDFKVFLQSASEVEAINMVIGAASTGAKAMTATSGPGFSLMQEGISYAAGMELPIVVVDVNRAGPGLGNLGPEQSDYFQATRGGGHGGSRSIVLAPNSVQEMGSFPSLAFSLAFKYRNPVVILADAFLGQLKEDIVFPKTVSEKFEAPWAATGSMGGSRHLILSLHLDFEDQKRHSEDLMGKYERVDSSEQRAESYLTDDASVVLVAYGVVSRVCREVVDELRSRGVKAGMFRPVTLSPFPAVRLAEVASRGRRRFIVVELNMGQMVYDVRLAVGGAGSVESVRDLGGMVPTAREIARAAEGEKVG
ncbi:MAG TPA: 3-methyl-2-oxobutanoate dehydrogenase subunit VorB [Nitrososphaerales archaeon]|nr:3-methyl-2-oxobutanoate dehydrogenase subunit VorB [Nitrososphaerales archaeon]